MIQCYDEYEYNRTKEKKMGVTVGSVAALFASVPVIVIAVVAAVVALWN